MRTMTTMILTATVCLAASGVSEAKGCLKGAAVGGVVGHVAGHHALAGAAAGCVIEHHREKVRDKEAAHDKAAGDKATLQPAPSKTPPASAQHPAPTPIATITPLTSI
jgi:hypothetical protein